MTYTREFTAEEEKAITIAAEADHFNDQPAPSADEFVSKGFEDWLGGIVGFVAEKKYQTRAEALKEATAAQLVAIDAALGIVVEK